MCLYVVCSFMINGVLMLDVSLENSLMNRVFRRKVTDSMNTAYVNVNYR